MSFVLTFLGGFEQNAVWLFLILMKIRNEGPGRLFVLSPYKPLDLSTKSWGQKDIMFDTFLGSAASWWSFSKAKLEYFILNIGHNTWWSFKKSISQDFDIEHWTLCISNWLYWTLKMLHGEAFISVSPNIWILSIKHCVFQIEYWILSMLHGEAFRRAKPMFKYWTLKILCFKLNIEYWKCYMVKLLEEYQPS